VFTPPILFKNFSPKKANETGLKIPEIVQWKLSFASIGLVIGQVVAISWWV
jgi:hypothetical protein